MIQKVVIYLLIIVNTCVSYKTNVLFIVLDDLKPALGSYGDSQAYTPNMDKLASKSFVFTKAYAQVLNIHYISNTIRCINDLI